MADSVTAQLIIDESKREPGPYFIFANTSENHSAYYWGKFQRNRVRVSGVPENQVGWLETYAEGTLRADEMLRSLVTYFAGRAEPTMLVWFGDHLPRGGQDYATYKATGYIAGQDDPQFLDRIYRVPVLIWNNYEPARKEQLSFGTNLLSPHILRQAGLAGTAFTDYLTEFGKQVPAVPAPRFWAELGLPEAELSRYEAVQQDIVNGPQRIYGELKERIVDPSFLLGHGPMVIEQVNLAPGGGAAVIRGKNLPRTGILFAGGRSLGKVAWESYEVVRADLPSGMLELELRVLDDDGAVIARSNVYRLPAP